MDLREFLKRNESVDILRFITCGSVDDGKSTLIGRLLYDAKGIFEDQLNGARNERGEIDFANLVDGLASEREQGITIDVAYRFFSTDKKKYIIADTPGHEQYTRNMATAASTADVAVILIDARKGVLTQSKRHSFIASLLGIRHIIVAINKMDLMDFRQDVFEAIKSDYLKMSRNLPHSERIKFDFIPISALNGDNILKNSENTPWYKGLALLPTLDALDVSPDRPSEFRFAVQYVNRPHLNFRGYCGTITGGEIRENDEVVVLPSNKKARVKSIITTDNLDLGVKGKDDAFKTAPQAFAPQAITLCLDREVDVSRGDMIAKPANLPRVTRKFNANIVWMNEAPLTPGEQYLIKINSNLINAQFDEILYKRDVNNFEKLKARRLELNDIAKCAVSLDKSVCADLYEQNRQSGSFIVIDRYTNATLGAGMITEFLGDGHDGEFDAKNASTREYSDAERELNAYVRKFYPEWGCKQI